MPRDFDLGSIQGQGSFGLDAFFDNNPSVVTPTPKRVRIASLSQLKPFIRLSAETLVHKSQRDLWAIKQEGGGMVIERLFNDDGNPVKG